MELRAGDRVRWTRNDPGSGLANGETAVVGSVEKDGVRFRLEDGSAAKLAEGNPQLRHLDRAWASTVHAFQGRTVDRIVAAMPTGNPNLTNQQSFYVAISRARDGAELVTDDAGKLSDQLEKATGERIAALDGVAKQAEHKAVFGVEPSRDGALESPETSAEHGHKGLESGKMDRDIDRGDGRLSGRQRDSGQEKTPAPKQKSSEIDLGL